MSSFDQGLISSWFAISSCILFAIVFVVSMFLFPISSNQLAKAMAQSGKVPRMLSRSHPLVIRQRVKGVVTASLVIPFYLLAVFWYSGVFESETFSGQVYQFSGLLGLNLPPQPIKILCHFVLPPLLVTILFTGPIFIQFLKMELPFQRGFRWHIWWEDVSDWIGFRNYIVGPVTEEFVFRSCMISIMAYSGSSFRSLVFGVPLVFGVAHVNHGYEIYIKEGRNAKALKIAVLTCIAKLLYTSVFGWFAAYLFLRTSSFWGACLSHALCNLQGLPEFDEIRFFGPWKKWIYLAHVIGLVSFGFLLNPMTEPSLYGDETNLAYWSIVVHNN